MGTKTLGTKNVQLLSYNPFQRPCEVKNVLQMAQLALEAHNLALHPQDVSFHLSVYPLGHGLIFKKSHNTLALRKDIILYG